MADEPLPHALRDWPRTRCLVAGVRVFILGPAGGFNDYFWPASLSAELARKKGQTR